MSVEKGSGDQGPTTAAGRPATWRSFTGSIAAELGLLVLAGVFWQQTGKFAKDTGDRGLGPASFPRLLIALLVLAVLVRLVQQVLEHRRATRQPEGDAATDTGVQVSSEEPVEEAVVHVVEGGVIAEEDYPTDNRRMLIGFGLAIGYVLGTVFLGYPLATFLLVVLFITLASKFSWASVAVGLGTALIFPYVFVKAVFISLPTGYGVFDSFTVWLYNLLGIY